MRAGIVIIGLLGLANCESVRFESFRPRVECLCTLPDAADGLGDLDVMQMQARWTFGPSNVAPDTDDDDSDN